MVVAPGSGHPQDLATPRTPVAHTAEDVVRLATGAGTLGELDARSTVCRACPRLVAWREEVARTRRRAYADEDYWGRPVSGFGAVAPRILVMGLAPAAHGGNRTGRIFTGDRSGDWLFAALYRAGLASQPIATHAGDGMDLLQVRISLGVRCAPPANRPTPQEGACCAGWLQAELALTLPSTAAVVVLGAIAWTSTLRALAGIGVALPRPLPRFGHGAEVTLANGLVLLGCYHVSQQNTFTGRLTEPMLDAVFSRARQVAQLDG
ncbi:MAG: uracil-DNA glycosylase [Frankiales bacterium]|nr:uracil-DNA glycosylase [Frankiales bacterium]